MDFMKIALKLAEFELLKSMINFKPVFIIDDLFDKLDKKFALDCILAAYEGGARWVVLCDTNGGTLPDEVEKIIREITKHIPGKNLGIHAHNDTGNAVANSLAAVSAGVRQVQGTINGLGERCGNANLMSFIPTICILYTSPSPRDATLSRMPYTA